MFATPATRTSIRPKAAQKPLFKPRASSTKGQAWGFLAAHYRKDTGEIRTTLHQILEGAYLGFNRYSLRVIPAQGCAHVALLFADGGLLVGWTDAPTPCVPYGRRRRADPLDGFKGIGLHLSPVLFSVCQKRLIHTWPAYDAQYAGLPALETHDPAAEGQFRRELARAVEDGQTLGPVVAPWSAQPGALVAPWILGKHRSETLSDLLKAAILGHDLFADSGMHDVHIRSTTLREDGTFSVDDIVVACRTFGGPLEYSIHAVLTDWLRARLQSAGCPIPVQQLIAHNDTHHRYGQKAHARTATILSELLWQGHHMGGHEHLRLRSLFQSAQSW